MSGNDVTNRSALLQGFNLKMEILITSLNDNKFWEIFWKVCKRNALQNMLRNDF